MADRLAIGLAPSEGMHRGATSRWFGTTAWVAAALRLCPATAAGAESLGQAQARPESTAQCVDTASRYAVPALSAGAGYLDTAGRARVIGYNDMDEMLAALSARFNELHPHIRFALDLPSTRSAPPALTAGTSAFAPMGAAFTADEAAQFRKRWGHEPLGFRVAHASLQPGALTSPLGVLVHPANPMRRIRLTDVRRIFVAADEGRPIEFWGELGLSGPWRKRRLHRVGLGETTALGRFLLEGPLPGSRFVQDYRRLPQSREVAAAVAGDASAIGLANLSNVGASTRALAIVDANGRVIAPTEREVRKGTYPFDRHLLIYVRRDREGRVEPLARAFLGFVLSCEGQRIVAVGTRGYLPLNENEIAVERRKLDAVSHAVSSGR
jgi:phosphate transport system substrate-binding protein